MGKLAATFENVFALKPGVGASDRPEKGKERQGRASQHGYKGRPAKWGG